MFIDVHCHIDMLENLDKVVARAKKKGIEVIVTNGVNPESNREVMELSRKFKEVKFSAGMYPIDALALTEKGIEEEIKFIRKNKDKIIAIGEVGLDLKHDTRNKGFTRQKKIFTRFVNLAIELDKPLIVHSRKAEQETIELLEKLNAKKVNMHCFSGRLNLADRIVGNGWYLSIPANVKFSEHFQKITHRVPITNLLCETDSPYLHPDKDFPNEPHNVVISYKKIAEIKSLELRDVEKEIGKNFKRLFLKK
jgi:TatD DNase family protein